MWGQFDQLPVLIADDSEDDLILLQMALQRADVLNPQVVATTGGEVIEYLERSLAHDSDQPFPAVLFLDLMMPRVNGFTVLEWLRDHAHPPLTVVLHTGIEDDLQLRRAESLGAHLFLPKGARAEAIREVFRRARATWEQHHLVTH